jgi:hypothetical protein
MYAQIEKHGMDLLRIYPNSTIKDPVKLCKTLRTLEVRAHRFATDYCNGVSFADTDEKIDATIKEYKDQTRTILGTTGPDVFINLDARGYALKIDDAIVRSQALDIHRDWGGYGIIAPEFDGN